VTLIAFAIYRPSCALAARAARKIGFSPGTAWAAAVLMMSLPVTLLVWLASYRHTPSLWPSVTEYVSFYGSVTLIGAGLMLVVWLVSQASSTTQVLPPAGGQELAPLATAPDQDGVAAPPSRSCRLLLRLPLEVRGEILALQMEDHYVRVHTVAGNTLLLMRMRDAISELEGADGVQVHRSWWVARAAVQEVYREGRRVCLELQSGTRVPVSRERMQSLPEWMISALAGPSR
jgi:hypothetical protein